MIFPKMVSAMAVSRLLAFARARAMLRGPRVTVGLEGPQLFCSATRGLPRGKGDSQPAHLPVEGIAADTELARHAADVAVVQVDLAQQCSALRLLQRIQGLRFG